MHYAQNVVNILNNRHTSLLAQQEEIFRKTV